MPILVQDFILEQVLLSADASISKDLRSSSRYCRRKIKNSFHAQLNNASQIEKYMADFLEFERVMTPHVRGATWRGLYLLEIILPVPAQLLSSFGQILARSGITHLNLVIEGHGSTLLDTVLSWPVLLSKLRCLRIKHDCILFINVGSYSSIKNRI